MLFPLMLGVMLIFSAKDSVTQDGLAALLDGMGINGADMAQRLLDRTLLTAAMVVLAAVSLLILILNSKRLAGLLVVGFFGITCGLIFAMLGTVGDVMFASFINGLENIPDTVESLKSAFTQAGISTICIGAGLVLFKLIFGNLLARKKHTN